MILCTIHHVMGTTLVCNIVNVHIDVVLICSYICVETSDFEQGFSCSKLSFFISCSLLHGCMALGLGPSIKFSIHNSLL